MLTGQRIAEFLGRGDDTELATLAGHHLPVVTAFVRAYTRGNGFYVLDEPEAALSPHFQLVEHDGAGFGHGDGRRRDHSVNRVELCRGEAVLR